MKDRSVLKNGEFYLWLILLGIWALRRKNHEKSR